MGINKIAYGNSTLIDLTGDTITADRLWVGFTAHDRSGVQMTGTLTSVPLEPIEYDYNIGYINNGSWIYENPTRTYTDIYEVYADHTYLVGVGETRGSRMRAMFCTTDIRTVTSGTVAGTNIVNVNNPAAYRTATGKAPADGYLLFAKDNVGVSGLLSHVYDLTASWL